MKSGEIWLVDLSDIKGPGTSGIRPGIVTGYADGRIAAVPCSAALSSVRFPYTYPVQQSLDNGLERDHVALVFRITVLDRGRFVRCIGKIPDKQYQDLIALVRDLFQDNGVIEREILGILQEILDLGLISTCFNPSQLAMIITGFHSGKNDTEIGRDLGNVKLSKSIARARIGLKLFRKSDFRMPVPSGKMETLLASGKSMNYVAGKLGISPSCLREYRHLRDVQNNRQLDPYLEQISTMTEHRIFIEKTILDVE